MRKLSLILGVFVLPFLVFAEVNPGLVESRKSELQEELKAYEQQISQYQDLVQQKQQEGNSLKRDIDILNAKISSAKLAIKARDISIKNLNQEIQQKSENISFLSGEMGKSKEALGDFLRRINERDSFSAVEIALVYQDLSLFLNEVESTNQLQFSLQDSLGRFENLKVEEEDAREDLLDKKNEELELRSIQELQKKKLDIDEVEKQKILKTTKGKEAEYQKVLNDKKKSAATIKSQLFLLTWSPYIPFEKAV